MHIEWEFPEPRRWDLGAKLLGPGYTRAELVLTLVCALGCALVAMAAALRADPALEPGRRPYGSRRRTVAPDATRGRRGTHVVG